MSYRLRTLNTSFACLSVNTKILDKIPNFTTGLDMITQAGPACIYRFSQHLLYRCGQPVRTGTCNAAGFAARRYPCPETKPLQHRYCPDPQSAFDPEELLLCWFCGQPSAISRPQQKRQKTAVQPPDQTIKDACLHQGLQINPDARTGAGQKTQTRPLSPALLRNDHVWQNWACDYKAEWPRTSPDG